jgi:uncharacterized protein (TIGR02145 family)
MCEILKKSIFLSLFYLSISCALAQSPNKMSFQSLLRNQSGELLRNKNVNVRISIIKTNFNVNTVLYVETHQAKTNTEGLLTLKIGTGVASTGTFGNIDWSQNNLYRLKTEFDFDGNTNFYDMSLNELTSVPYAFHSKKSYFSKSAKSSKKLVSGTVFGVMNYWNGSAWVPINTATEGQQLTSCDGKPIWTNGGVCPGTIQSINCYGLTHKGVIKSNALILSTDTIRTYVPYSGGNGGPFPNQTISSKGVTGLTATLQADTFKLSTGILTYSISGTAASSGTAIFEINIGGQSCTFARLVNTTSQQPISGSGSTISDIEGNSYKTVYIGTQQWMAENLRVSKYNDGTAIPNIINSNDWVNLSTKAWCYHDNKVENDTKYGKLYNWYAVSLLKNGYKNVCPTGWHVPASDEWSKLITYLGGTSVAGGKMKEVGTISWASPNSEATNSSLFTAQASASRLENGFFGGIGSHGSWWSTSEINLNNALSLDLTQNNAAAFIWPTGNSKKVGYSVRCVKD